MHTTPPMISAAAMPPGPFRPATTMMTEERIRVMSVIPLTGLEPTMAIALAATVVKRKEMTATMSRATTVKRTLPSITSK